MPLSPIIIAYSEAGLDDVRAIARVESDTKRECGLTAPDRYDVEKLRAGWDEYVRGLSFPQKAERPRVVFKAEHAGRMIGYVAGHFSGRYDTEGELQSIHVLKAHHGQGVGTELLRHLARWFVGHGRRRVCVGVAPQNAYKRFYEKHGAAHINDHWLVWDDIARVLSAAAPGESQP